MRRVFAIFRSSIVCVLLAAGPAHAAQITLAWDANPETDISGYIVEYGPASAPYTQSVNIGNTTTWTLAAATAGVSYSFRILAYNAAGEVSAPSASVTATAAATGPAPTATLTADRSALVFAISTAPQARTSSQVVRLTQAGSGSISWTATSSAAWLQVSPASGTGAGALTVSLVTAAAPASGSTAATISIVANGAANGIAPIAVTLNILPASASQAPFGAVDTPSDNATGVTGSMAMTGWAVDDVDVTRVRIVRDPVAGETPGQLIFVGNAMLVEDARPDVAAAYPAYPQSVRGGWGYLLLTNMLPALGNGTFRFSAYADDADGHSTLLGSRTVTCANASATQPFGAIDTPAPGETVAGNIYTSFGWVLARGPRRADVPGGGRVSVVIDGVVAGTPNGWANRADLTGLFPATQYPGITSALAVFAFDTTTLSNGVHTMAWVVTDDQGNAAGIGSRYFRVLNGAAAQVSSLAAAGLRMDDEVGGAMRDAGPVEARRGFEMDAPFRPYAAGSDGRVTLQSEELDRIEIVTRGASEGFLVVGNTLRPLPIGSRLDPSTGTFVWQPGVGFVGSYDLAFLHRSQRHGLVRQDVRVVLNPKGSNRVGAQIVVDIAQQSGSAQPAVIAGWAADLDSPTDRGIDLLHVWAYPTGPSTLSTGSVRAGDPVFVGEASYGGDRPDVAAVYGDRFRASGYGIRVEGLQPGTYDVAIFAWSSAKHAWLPAKVVPIEVR